MPFSRLTLEEAAEYLHITRQELGDLVKTRDIPFVEAGGQVLFPKNELNKWISQKLLSMKKESLAKFHHQATELRCVIDAHQAFLSDLISIECIDPALPARTRPSVLRELAALAMKTGYLTDEKELVRLLEEREGLGSTGLEKGIALPHPVTHPPYLFLDSFVLLARVPAGIPYGAVDGQDTDLFFMPCAHDDRHHVYMLARLALMLNNTGLAEELRAADTVEQMLAVFRHHEREAVAKMAKVYKKIDE